MNRLLLATLALGLAACGVTAGNPGDSGKTQRFSLYGSVQTPERDGYQPAAISVADAYGAPLSTTTSDERGFYAFDDLPAGTLVVRVGAAFTQPVQVNADTLLNVVVPLPAPPSNARHIDLGPADLCILWNDASAVERSFTVRGPAGPVTAPAGAAGVRFYLPPATDAAAGDPAHAAAWNARFAGEWAVTAENEYGASASAPVTVPPLDPARWSTLLPPQDPPLAAGDPQREACLSAPRDAGGPAFVVP